MEKSFSKEDWEYLEKKQNVLYNFNSLNKNLSVSDVDKYVLDNVSNLDKKSNCKDEKVNQQSFNYTKALDKVTSKKPVCSKCKKEVKIVYGNLNLCANCISKSSMEYDKD